VLIDYEAALGYFPFRYRRNADPMPFALSMPAGCYLPSGGFIDVANYRRATGLTIDTQTVWVNASQPESEACVRAYGRPVSAERHNDHGKLMWFDSEH